MSKDLVSAMQRMYIDWNRPLVLVWFRAENFRIGIV
jgi:hypothetical protein